MNEIFQPIGTFASDKSGTGKPLYNTVQATGFPPVQKMETPSFGEDLSTGGKVLALLPGIGSIGGLIMQGAGMWLQYKYQKEAQNRADQWTTIQNAIAERERRKQWKWMEEEKDYNRSQAFLGNLFGMMKTEKQFESDLLNMWRTSK